MSRRKKVPKELVSAYVESLSHDGRGVARVNGKTTFIDGALPGETVTFRYLKTKSKYDEACVEKIDLPSSKRVEAKCKHYGVCGGCGLQHMSIEEQIQFKQETMLLNMKNIGGIIPQEIFSPLMCQPWGYRRKARIGVKYVHKKERVLIGFREKQSRYLADLTHCEILHPSIGYRLEEFASVIRSLSNFEQIPQIEVAIGDDEQVLIFRHLTDFSEDDYTKLRAFGEQTGIQIYSQSKGPESVTRIYPERENSLVYRLADFDLELAFLPTDFTQINAEINQLMVSRAIQLLEIKDDERVLDLFCGIGNFSLAIARYAKSVVAVEGDQQLVNRAGENAIRNQLSNVEFHYANLFEEFLSFPWAKRHYPKILIDPPRSGAWEVVKNLKKLNPAKLVYVSCDTATLARDAAEICGQGYVLTGAGVMDMFPHTGHVESIAVFDKK